MSWLNRLIVNVMAEAYYIVLLDREPVVRDTDERRRSQGESLGVRKSVEQCYNVRCHELLH